MADLRFIVNVYTEDSISDEDKILLGDRLTDACAEVFPDYPATVHSSPA